MPDPFDIPLEDKPGYQYGSILPYSIDPSGHASLDFPEIIRAPVRDIATALQAPAAALHGQLSDEDMARAAGATGRAMLEVNPPVALGEPNIVRAFGGIEARTADLDALKQATVMRMRGESPEEIWNQTGWFKDVDKQWKFEIPDIAAKLNQEGLKANPYTSGEDTLFGPNHVGPRLMEGDSRLRLGDILDHPDLYAAYPMLKNYPISDVGLEGALGGVKGAFNPESETIRLGSQVPKELQSTLHHEIQHGIQHVEGFAEGGNVQQFLPKDFDEKFTAAAKGESDALDKLVSAANLDSPYDAYRASWAREKLADGQELGPWEQDTWKPHLDKLSGMPEFEDWMNAKERLKPLEEERSQAFDKYLSLAGEVEARNVQERLAQGLGRETAPWRTQGYPSGAQIINLAGKKLLAQPVEHDPFTHEAQPVEYNPFTQEQGK